MRICGRCVGEVTRVRVRKTCGSGNGCGRGCGRGISDPSRQCAAQCPRLKRLPLETSKCRTRTRRRCARVRCVARRGSTPTHRRSVDRFDSGQRAFLRRLDVRTRASGRQAAPASPSPCGPSLPARLRPSPDERHGGSSRSMQEADDEHANHDSQPGSSVKHASDADPQLCAPHQHWDQPRFHAHKEALPSERRTVDSVAVTRAELCAASLARERQEAPPGTPRPEMDAFGFGLDVLWMTDLNLACPSPLSLSAPRPLTSRPSDRRRDRRDDE